MPDQPAPSKTTGLYYGWVVAAVSTFGVIATAPGQTGGVRYPLQNLWRPGVGTLLGSENSELKSLEP